MAITKSAKKAIRQSAKKRIKNIAYKNKIKNLVKEAGSLAAANKQSEIKKILPSIYKAFDKAAKAGVIKKNTASRKKARFARLAEKK